MLIFDYYHKCSISVIFFGLCVSYFVGFVRDLRHPINHIVADILIALVFLLSYICMLSKRRSRLGGVKGPDNSLKASTVFLKATIIIIIVFNSHPHLNFHYYCYNLLKTVLTASYMLMESL